MKLVFSRIIFFACCQVAVVEFSVSIDTWSASKILIKVRKFLTKYTPDRQGNVTKGMVGGIKRKTDTCNVKSLAHNLSSMISTMGI